MIGLKNISYADVQQHLNSQDRQSLRALRLAVLRNITVEPIEPYLAYLALDMRRSLEVSYGRFDTILQDASSGLQERMNNETDAVLIFFYLGQCSEVLSRRFITLTRAAIETEVERILNYVRATVEAIRKHSSALILWHSFECQPFPAFGVADSTMVEGQNNTIIRLNSAVRDILSTYSGTTFVDMNAILARVGMDKFYDHRYWHLARSPYGLAALREIAIENFKLIRAMQGFRRKCLVIDCDNTLWKGVVGEDGVDGIELGTTYSGSACREFQQELLNLHNRGILLALSSKNNPEDVWEVFDSCEGMVLGREHIVAHRINWDDKASNIVSIAQELNIGLDSIVFLDDSMFEVERVKRALPEVTSILLDSNRPYEYRWTLLGLGLFDALSQTSEDRELTSLYRTEAARRMEREAAEDIQTFLSTLEMRARVEENSNELIPRVAQLTQKTNQFNLTTRRYGEGDIAAFCQSSEHDIFTIYFEDKFGTYGVVGVCILHYRRDDVLVDTFLLSCRALGREIEDAFLATVMAKARKKGATCMIGEYIPTKKNRHVSAFYPALGFSPEGDYFVYDLSNELPQIPAHTIVTLSETP